MVTAPRTAAPPPPPASAPVSGSEIPATSDPIVALGDSLTFGWGRGASSIAYGPAPEHSYPWYLERDLEIPVVNAGISGTTAHEVLDPASEPDHPRPEPLRLPALLALHPRLMIVSFGSNEAQRGWPVSQAAADLERLLDRISAAGVPMVLVGTHVDCVISPCQTPPPGYTRQRYLANWDAALTRLAARHQAGLVLDVERGFAGDDLTDWIHPTALGYWRMTRRIEPQALAVLKRAAPPSSGPHAAQSLPGRDGTPPSQQDPQSNAPPDHPQAGMGPGGPREFLPWNVERVLSLLGDWGRPVGKPTGPFPRLGRSPT